MCEGKDGKFALFEWWKAHRIEITLVVYSSGMETVKVRAVVMEGVTAERVRELLEASGWQVVGDGPTVKRCHLWVLDLGMNWYPIYGEDEEEAEYRAAVLVRSNGERVLLEKTPQGRGEYPGAITMVSYEAQRVIAGEVGGLKPNISQKPRDAEPPCPLWGSSIP